MALTRCFRVLTDSLSCAAVIGPGGQATAATYICADTPLAQTFGRGLAEVNGEFCRVTDAAVVQPTRFAARCEALGRRLR